MRNLLQATALWNRRGDTRFLRFARDKEESANYANNGSTFGDRGVRQRGGTDTAPGASIGLRWRRIWVPEGHEFIEFS
jgi:hypothetical protein